MSAGRHLGGKYDFADLVRQQLSGMPVDQIILDPHGQDTAACIALAALYVGRPDPDAVMVMLPAAHLIRQEEQFRETLRTGIRAASENECLVSLGIRPTRRETGYGYIQVGDRWGDGDEAYRVTAFEQKPPRERAMAYLQSGK